MKVTLSKIRSNPDDTVWASPRNISDTVRYKRTISDKSIGSSSIPNVRQEIISNRTVVVALCDSKCAGEEVLSVRTSMSGSFKNAAEMVRMIDDHIATLNKFKTASVNYGFGPNDSLVVEYNYAD